MSNSLTKDLSPLTSRSSRVMRRMRSTDVLKSMPVKNVTESRSTTVRSNTFHPLCAAASRVYTVRLTSARAASEGRSRNSP
jgi:hypothetical protein